MLYNDGEKEKLHTTAAERLSSMDFIVHYSEW